MTYAIIATGGKQYKVELGRTYRIELLPPTKNKSIILDQVLLLAEDGKVQVGTPYVKGVTVAAEIIEASSMAAKLMIFKYKAKSRYRKTRGHRQKHTLIKVTAIGSKTLTPVAKTPKVAKSTTSTPSPKKSAPKKSSPKKTATK